MVIKTGTSGADNLVGTDCLAVPETTSSWAGLVRMS